MALKVDASFENGVFVPAKPPGLAERERVRLTIEPAALAHADLSDVGERADRNILGSQTDRAIALDFHPDGC